MSDNYFGTTFGPSTPGALNIISGDTGNFNLVNNNPATAGHATSPNTALVADGQGGYSDINDSDPFYDDCSSTTSNIGINNASGTSVTDPNIGDLLNAAGLSWGWFQGGFTPTTTAGSGGNPATGMTTGYTGGPAGQSNKAVCGAAHNKGAALGGTGSTGAQTPDWANTAVVVTYDDSDGWYDHVYAGNETGQTGAQNPSSAGGSPTLGDAENPPVCGGTPIKGTALAAPTATVITTGTNDTVTYTIGGGSTQTLTIPGGTYTVASLATAISTASANVITAESNSANDLVLTDNGLSALAITGGDALTTLGLTSGAASVAASQTLTNTAGQPENGRCGFGPRLPLMVISPYAKANSVDHTLSDQASIPNFIEYNWGLSPIPGSADHLLTNPASTFDLANMFDFAPNAPDIAGPASYYLDPATFQSTSMPQPVLPEAPFPILLPIVGVVIIGGPAYYLFGWRRRRSTALTFE